MKGGFRLLDLFPITAILSAAFFTHDKVICEMIKTYRFDPVDLEQVRMLGRLFPGRRIQTMLDARELAVGLIRGASAIS